MTDTHHFLAVDLGATSGRTILGSMADGRLQQREITRFPNDIIPQGGHLYWDIFALYREILHGLRLVAAEGIQLTSIGIDAWGCDFVCVGRDGGILRNPLCYRDPHTDGAQEEYFKLVDRDTVYAKTGIQFMNFNSLFQLHTMRRNADSALAAADKVLFIPDALSYMLTGQAVCEYSVLSTAQLLNPRTGEIDADLLRPLGLDRSQFGPMVRPGTRVGTLTDDVQKATGLGPVPVIAVAGHDTASAVAAVPAAGTDFAYLSCGTWSLLGIESPQPIIHAESQRYNFTNEGGVDGTTRFLKNICGMWLLEQCRKEWSGDASIPSDVGRLVADAASVPFFRSFINPDDEAFAHPQSMQEAIRRYCATTSQPVPQSYAEVVRVIFDSLAMRYRQVLSWLDSLAPMPIRTLHAIGGGTHNHHLMQMTANAIGRPVVAGPVEGTAIGNIMMQARAAGLVDGLASMRRIIADSIEMRRYEPTDAALWDAAYARFLQATSDPNAAEAH